MRRGSPRTPACSHRRNIPSAVAEYQVWNVGDLATTRHAHCRAAEAHDLFPASVVKDTDVVTGRRLLLGNGDVRPYRMPSRAPRARGYNGIGDECVYVERGRARVETVFGAFEVGRVTTSSCRGRRLPAGGSPEVRQDPLRIVIEAGSHRSAGAT